MDDKNKYEDAFERSDYSVWVGGGEVNGNHLTKKEAEKLADKYRKDGYEDVVIEKQCE